MERRNLGIRILTNFTILGLLVSSCSSMDNRDTYLGTMAGADIGGTIGEAIGWILTDRNEGPGKAMAGSILGTVAGAVIGNQIGSKKAQKPKKRKKGEMIDDDTWYNSSNPTYQISGGENNESFSDNNNKSNSYSFNTEYCPQIGKITYQDENGDGEISAYETINVIFEVTNHSSRTRDVDLNVCEDLSKNTKPSLVCSPTTTTTLAAGEAIRYKAKVFLKRRVKESYIQVIASAKFKDGTEADRNLRIKCADR